MNDMKRCRTSVLMLCWIASCSGPQRGADPVASTQSSGLAESTIAVSAMGWVVTPEAPQGRALQADDALGENDRASLHVQVSQPAYLYVVQVSGTGGATPLFPETGHRQVAAQQMFRIPENEARALSVEPKGRGERFLIIASRNPLSSAACTAFSLRCGTSTDLGRGGDADNKSNTQNPDKRGDRFVVDTQTTASERATIVTYSVTPRRR